MTDITTQRPSFMQGKKKLWKVPKIKDYRAACELGELYAKQYIKWLAANPSLYGANMIMVIISDMDFKKKHRGIEVGFLSALEKQLHFRAKAIAPSA